MGVLSPYESQLKLFGSGMSYSQIGERVKEGMVEQLSNDYPSHSAQIDRIAKGMSDDTIGRHAWNRFDELDRNLTALSEMGLDDTQIGRVLDDMEKPGRTEFWTNNLTSANFASYTRRIAGDPAPTRSAASRPAQAATGGASGGAAAASSGEEAEASASADPQPAQGNAAPEEESQAEAGAEELEPVDTSGDPSSPGEGEAGGFAGLFGGNFDLSQIFGGFDLSNMGGGAFESLQNILPGIGSLLTGVFSDMTHHSGTALTNLEADGNVSMMARFETVLDSAFYSIGKANRVGNGSMYESSDIPVNFDGSVTSTVDAETGVEREGPPPAPSQGTEPTQPQPGQQAPAAMAQNMPGQQGPQTPRPSGPDDTAFA